MNKIQKFQKAGKIASNITGLARNLSKKNIWATTVANALKKETQNLTIPMTITTPAPTVIPLAQDVVKNVITVPEIIAPRWGFGSGKIPGTDTSDWRPAYDIYTKFNPRAYPWGSKEIDEFVEELHKTYPFGFDPKEFKSNFFAYSDVLGDAEKSIYNPELVAGQTLLRMGKPVTYVNVPQEVARFYKKDVIPRLYDKTLISKIDDILNGKIQHGYLPDQTSGAFYLATGCIRINDLEAFGPRYNNIVAHEMNHAFRYNPKIFSYTFSKNERDALDPFYLNKLHSAAARNEAEVAATAAENRFDYWQALNNSNNSNEVTNPADVNRYIDAMPDYDLYKNLFSKNGYHVASFPIDYNGVKVPEISEEQLKESAEKIRDLLKYVPAIGTAAVLPNVMNESTNTKQESNN